MKHYKFNGKVLSFAALTMFASVVHAEGETASDFNGKGKVAVKVKNTLDIVEQSQLNFGLIAAVASQTGTASLALNATDGTLGSPTKENGASITSIDSTGISPGTFLVTNAAKYTDLNIELPTSDVDLVMDGAGPNSPAFKLGSFTAAVGNDAVNLSGTPYYYKKDDIKKTPLYKKGDKYYVSKTDLTEVKKDEREPDAFAGGGVGKATTDGNGNLELKVGATLSTIKPQKGDATVAYADAVYNGTYAVIIKY